MSSAFASRHWHSMDVATQELLPRELWKVGEQRYRSYAFAVPCRDQPDPVMMRPACGGLVGDPHVVYNFVAVFSHPVDQ
eukprot:5907240-Pyramimonas_sp.AAC.1